MKSIILIFFIVLISFSESQGALKKGDPAPDFSIIGQDGKTYNLSQFKSKVVLIKFMSIKCFACDLVIPDINMLNEKFSKEDLIIVGVFLNDEIEDFQGLIQYSKNKGIKYPLYIGDRNLKKQYNLFGFPNFIIINEKKQIVQIYRGITRDTFGLLSKEIDLIINRGGK